MKINSTKRAQTMVVQIEGSIDALTADQVTRYLSQQISSQQVNLVINLAQVDFMSSAGLRAMLATMKESRRMGGDLRLAAAQSSVEKILKMSGFTHILKSYPTEDEAVKSFGV
jgi:anti-anti-sigma factor